LFPGVVSRSRGLFSLRWFYDLLVVSQIVLLCLFSPLSFFLFLLRLRWWLRLEWGAPCSVLLGWECGFLWGHGLVGRSRWWVAVGCDCCVVGVEPASVCGVLRWSVGQARRGLAVSIILLSICSVGGVIIDWTWQVRRFARSMGGM